MNKCFLQCKTGRDYVAQELTWELVELDAEAEPALQQLVKRVRLS